MIQLSQCKLPIDHDAGQLENKIRKSLKLRETEELHYQILRRSIDSRQKPCLFFVYTLSVTLSSPAREKQCLSHLKSKDIRPFAPALYQPDRFLGGGKPDTAPCIVGAGPAGLFAAYLLCRNGYTPIVIERGSRVEERKQTVEAFWKSGVLDPSTNVQFGEGGAGTFSDGKLNTSVKDPSGRIRFVLETFVSFGAPAEILIDQKPHIGTDLLEKIIVNMRHWMEARGAVFCFDTQAEDFLFEKGRLKGLLLSSREGKRTVEASHCILAIGHSARDTFSLLYQKGLAMEAKSFAVGFRVEHPQSMIDLHAYGKTESTLGASPYKVTSNFPNGRGVYSFCMCPGGYVVNSSSEQGRLAVNGMSLSARSGPNANSAIIVSVGPRDYKSSAAAAGLTENHPLAGLVFQKDLEEKAFLRAGGAIPQQLFGDFRNERESRSYGDFSSCTRGKASFASLRGILSPDMEESLIAGMEHFDRIIPGFARADAIMSGVESRTSSPLRILRDENLTAPGFSGLYPCGEGAGYAGGITSAAVDGLKTAEAIMKDDHCREI